MSVTAQQINSLIASQKATFLANYKRIVESPSVSAQHEHHPDILETAKIAASYLKDAGAQYVKIYETKGNPVVFGRITNKEGAPTVAIYNHLDVQPAAKGKDGWTRDPFVFTEENGRYYSRGATDDKGPAMTALWGAKIARELGVETNIEFIWELEEEIGSPNFEEFITKAQGDIKAKSVLVSDTLWLSPEIPSITRGLRGLQGFLVRLRTGQKDVHSGVAGGAARNPVTELCGLIAKCVDAKTGDILIPGFDKTWTRPSKEELNDHVRSGFSVDTFKAANKLSSLRYTTPEDVISRIWFSPTFEVHGIAGGYQDEGLKTVVPPFAEAKISMRLVPGQNPDEIAKLFTSFAKSIIPDCEVVLEHGLFPYAAPSHLAENEYVAKAYEFGFGVKPASVREGGSIGAVVTMADKLQVPILFMGMSLPEDSYHGPDESFAWHQVEGGVRAFVKYFELFGEG
jgi:acetylornithine deacetylase/succinyl-diaminopimelate desuccinylase-like protein